MSSAQIFKGKLSDLECSMSRDFRNFTFPRSRKTFSLLPMCSHKYSFCRPFVPLLWPNHWKMLQNLNLNANNLKYMYLYLRRICFQSTRISLEEIVTAGAGISPPGHFITEECPMGVFQRTIWKFQDPSL